MVVTNIAAKCHIHRFFSTMKTMGTMKNYFLALLEIDLQHE